MCSPYNKLFYCCVRCDYFHNDTERFLDLGLYINLENRVYFVKFLFWHDTVFSGWFFIIIIKIDKLAAIMSWIQFVKDMGFITNCVSPVAFCTQNIES